MAETRIVGSAGGRRPVGGKPVDLGDIANKGKGTRPIPMPKVKRTYTRCESKTKAGQPCKAPNVKGEPYCQGHLNQQEARGRRRTN